MDEQPKDLTELAARLPVSEVVLARDEAARVAAELRELWAGSLDGRAESAVHHLVVGGWKLDGVLARLHRCADLIRSEAARRSADS
ncbi:hypothetical protein [Actinoalloteichus hymeniacidonis]|uniref:Uncharacterized protein n=1 Tax=Actinoalloteichus hymeniacidonis TaxID=340345 RepID=A0AAC9HV01_9PSEU|nr:hypothetical protein [Actinoalloteichus hymeniacidonis]AOS65636.1 hypothetical protein TL08_24290 [Actinoalloteichus hymeniacidonis]MBB5906274.1 hypothetical protein [Actinoalloteichus hymeniacidonis]